MKGKMKKLMLVAAGAVLSLGPAFGAKVAFLGGSITEMAEGYRPRVMKGLRAQYPQVEFTEIAAGLASTCSDAAAFRLGEDVLAQGVPDLLVLEEVVNDDQDGHFSDARSVRGVEGTIRQVLLRNPSCAVVVALMVNAGQYALLEKESVPPHYAVHTAVARHYGAEIADVGSALVASARAGGMSWKEYADCHPSPEGCEFAAGVVLKAIGKAFDPTKTPTTRTLPPPMDAGSYFRAAVVPEDSLELGKGWQISEPDWTSVPGAKRDYFIRGKAIWSETAGAELAFSFSGTAAGAFLTAGPDAGDLEVSVDGGLFERKKLRADYGQLHYPYVQMLADGLKDGPHTIRLRVAAAERKGRTCSAIRIRRLFVNGEECRAPLSEYVPVMWTGEPKEKQVKVLRRLHDEYGFRRFVLIGPWQKESFGGASTEDFTKLGESIAWARKELSDLGDVELGWWLVPTLRGYLPEKGSRIMNSNGTEAKGGCPLAPGYTASICSRVAACVKAGRPRTVFIEDDYTLSNCAGQTKMGGCFCPLHCAAFAKRTGKALSAAEIAALFAKPTPENRPLREAFALTCRDSLAQLAGEIRRTIDAVDPTVRVCLCESGCVDLDGGTTEANARAFAGGTRPLVRVYGASYMDENSPLSLPRVVAHTFWSVQHLPADVETIHETDGYPHTRSYVSANFLGSELAAALMAGAHGTYYYCAPYVDEPLEEDGYAAWMRDWRERLRAVRDLRATMRPSGIRVIYSPAEVYLRRGNLRKGASGILPHAAYFLAKLGLPMTTAEDASAAVLFGDGSELMSDDEIRRVLSGGVLLDGETAIALTKRGYASLIGCIAEEYRGEFGYDREEIRPVAGCRAAGCRLMNRREASPGAWGGLAKLTPLEGTERWSELVDIDGKAVAPSVTFCRNALGGRVAVMHVSPAYGYGFNAATFHGRKQELFHRLFAKLSGGTVDVVAPKTPSTWVIAAKNADELLVMTENLRGEARADSTLAFGAAWHGRRVAHLEADGTWRDLGEASESFVLPAALDEPLKPEFFRVSAASAPAPSDPVTETSLATEMRAGYPAIRKAGAVSPYGEVSPFVFKGRLMRMELIDLSRGLDAAGKEICAGIRDIETGKILSTFGKDCYYFSAYCENDKVLVTGTERQNGGYAGDTIWAFESTDLRNWSRRKLLTRPGWRYFNTSLTKGPDGYVLLLESNDRRHATRPFTMFFATSKDLRTWTHMDDDICFPKHRYAGGPFIRYHNGFYYVSLVTELPNARYVTYLYRTADFRHWDCGRYNPLVSCSQDDRRLSPRAVDITPALAEQIKTHFIGSASDLEMCDFGGQTYINYIIGDQQGFYYMCEAWYDGPMGELLENCFK